MYRLVATVFVLLIMTSSIKRVKLIRSTCMSHGLLLTSNCRTTCPGYTLTYECTIMGGGLTVWQGSALPCQSSLSLRHSQIKNGTAFEQCNHGEIVVYGIGETGSYYTSQLNLTVSPDMNNTNVVCVHDNGNTNIIGSSTVIITMGPYPPPPDNLHLATMTQTQLTFSWNPLDSICPAVVYIINATGCGVCPSLTTNTSTTCTIANSDDDECLFSVRSEVCGNISRYSSEVIAVSLRVPEVSEVKYITLSGLDLILIVFNTFDLPYMTDDHVSTTMYTITYSDSTSGSSCATATIPASSCVGGTCRYVFGTASSFCPFSTDTKINVTVFGTNALGDGPTSVAVKHNSTSDYVREGPTSVTVEHSSTMRINRYESACKNTGPGSIVVGLLSSAALLVIILAVAISTVVIIISSRTKAKLQREIEAERKGMAIYDDIDLYPRHVVNINTIDNVAYDGKVHHQETSESTNSYTSLGREVQVQGNIQD